MSRTIKIKEADDLIVGDLISCGNCCVQTWVSVSSVERFFNDYTDRYQIEIHTGSRRRGDLQVFVVNVTDLISVIEYEGT